MAVSPIDKIMMRSYKATASWVQRKGNLSITDYSMIDQAAVMDGGFSRVRRRETARRCCRCVGRPAARCDCVDLPTGFFLGFHRSKREKSGGQKQAKSVPPPSVLDLARTSTDPDERTDFFERGAGCREHGVTIGTDWAEMRIDKKCLVQIRNSGKAGGV